MWGEITHPFRNINDEIIEAGESVSNVVPHFIMM